MTQNCFDLTAQPSIIQAKVETGFGKIEYPIDWCYLLGTYFKSLRLVDFLVRVAPQTFNTTSNFQPRGDQDDGTI